MYGHEKIGRILYLAAVHRMMIPNFISRLIPQGEIIAEVGVRGVLGAAQELNIDHLQLLRSFQEGELSGPGTEEEARALIVEIALNNLDLNRDEYKFSEYVRNVNLASAYLNVSDHLVDYAEVKLGSEVIGEDIPKWMTGFEPYDLVTGGSYQGICTVMGKPGSGKTTLMLAIMHWLRKTGIADEMWFYETEIPMSLMLYKMRPLRADFQYTDRDRLVCGMVPVQQILQEAQENPNPRRIIGIDSADVLAGGGEDGRRFAIEDIYRDLVRLKNCSLMVFNASQMRRTDKTVSIDSGSEAASKAWYSDIILGVHRLTTGFSGMQQVTLNVPKNRFGVPDQAVSFRFNYERYTWDVPEFQKDQLTAGQEEDGW